MGLLWHSVNSSNLGIGALTASHIKIVEGAAARAGVSVQFRVLGWRDDRPAYVVAENVASWPLRTRDLVKPIGGLAHAARSCDLILNIAAGDSFTDIYGPARALKVIGGTLIAGSVGRPMIFGPQTIGPFERRWSRTLAKRALRRAEAVFTRDVLSTSYLREIAFSGEAMEATDVAFRLPYEKTGLPLIDRPRVGVNPSGLLMNGGYTGANMFGLSVDYPKLMRRMLQWLTDEQRVEVHLVGHVLAEDMPIEDDYQAAQTLAKEFPSAVLAPRFTSPSAAKSYISGLDFFTGSRMHACIAAFSSGVPVLPLAYSRKFAGLFGTLGYDLNADCRSESEDQIMEKLQASVAKRSELRAKVIEGQAEAERRLSIYEDCIVAALADRAT